MFVFLLEVLTGKEGARLWSGPSFFAPPKKKWVRKCPAKTATAPVPWPTPAPSIAKRLATQSVTPTPSQPFHNPFGTRMNSFPPNPVTLSQVEDLVTTSEIIQALHMRTPPPALSPTSSAMELDAGPLSPPPLLPPSQG